MYADKEHSATREIEDGFYTVVRDDNVLFIFRISTHEPDAKVRPGQQVIAKGKGPYSRTFYNFGTIQDGHLYQYARWKDASVNAAIVDAATRLLDSDMEEAGKMYARTTNRCYICNRKLTVADSLATGIGPDCAGNRKRKELEPDDTHAKTIMKPNFSEPPSVKVMAEYIKALLVSIHFYEPDLYRAQFTDDQTPEQEQHLYGTFDEIRMALHVCREYFTERQQGLVRGKCGLNKPLWFFLGGGIGKTVPTV